MTIKTYVAVAFIIAAVPPILLHSASTVDYYNTESVQNKHSGAGNVDNGYWFLMLQVLPAQSVIAVLR